MTVAPRGAGAVWPPSSAATPTAPTAPSTTSLAFSTQQHHRLGDVVLGHDDDVVQPAADEVEG